MALTPNSFDASITIRPLDAATIDQFRTLSDAIVDTRGTLGPSANYISAPGALAEFTEVLLQRDTIVQAAGAKRNSRNGTALLRIRCGDLAG